MRVRITTNLGTNDYAESWLEGEVRDVSDDLGKLLLARRHAVEVAVPPPPVVETPEPAPKAEQSAKKTSK